MTGMRLALLLVLSGAVFMEGVDVSMMGVALPSIRAELGMATNELQWVVSAYVLGYGGFVLLGGRAADLLGRRRMFLLWMAVFVVFSGLGGVASEGWQVIVARFVTGVAAGFMAPAGLSIITTSFPEGRERNRALLIYAGVAAAGFSLGMVVGGLLTAIDWRWVFFAPVVMATLLLLVAFRVVPRDAQTRVQGSFDVGGALSITAAMIVLVFTVVRAPDVDVTLTLTGLVASAALLIAFVAIERRAPEPLVRLGILRSRSLLRANAGTMLFIGAFVAFQFVAVLYLQELRDWSPVETGLALVVLGIDAILAPTLTPRLVERFGKLPVIGAGTALAAIGYALFLRLDADWGYLEMLPTLLLVGLAFALTFGTLMIVATDGIDEAEQGLASGLQYVSLQFGAAVGLAIVAAVNVAATNGTSSAALLDGYQAALLVPVAMAALALAVTATGLGRYGLTSSRSGSGVGSTA
jgi:MFS family permease